MSAEIIRLSEYRGAAKEEPGVDLITAVDVALRDLRDIEAGWASDQALERLIECKVFLRAALTRALE
jgi:hypothetical protein